MNIILLADNEYIIYTKCDNAYDMLIKNEVIYQFDKLRIFMISLSRAALETFYLTEIIHY